MELKSNIKELIPQEWVRVQINEIVSTLGDGIHSTPIYSSNGDYYFINGNNLSDGKIVLDGATKRVNHDEYLKYKKNLNNNTILLSINGTIGNVAFYKNEPVILGKSVAYLTVKKEFSSEYLYYFLQSSSALNFFKDGLTGSTIKNLGLGVIRNTPISLPANIAEQTSIAKALSDADAWIQSLTQLIVKKRQIKQGVMQTLLNPFENGKLKDDWVEYEFIHLVDKYIDYRGRTPKKLGMTWGEGNILALSANNVQMGYIDFSKEAYQGSEDLYKKWMTQGECEKGDILLTMEAPLGNVAQLIDDNKYILSQRVILIKPKGKVIKDYLAWYMKGSRFQTELNKNASGSTAQGIQRKKLDVIFVQIPKNIKTQYEIASTLNDINEEIIELEIKLNKAKQIKQGMMQNLLTGRIRLI